MFMVAHPHSVQNLCSGETSSKSCCAEANIIEFYLTKASRGAEEPGPSEALGSFKHN